MVAMVVAVILVVVVKLLVYDGTVVNMTVELLFGDV